VHLKLGAAGHWHLHKTMLIPPPLRRSLVVYCYSRDNKVAWSETRARRPVALETMIWMLSTNMMMVISETTTGTSGKAPVRAPDWTDGDRLLMVSGVSV
jgi:hypothetical protein